MAKRRRMQSVRPQSAGMPLAGSRNSLPGQNHVRRSEPAGQVFELGPSRRLRRDGESKRLKTSSVQIAGLSGSRFLSCSAADVSLIVLAASGAFSSTHRPSRGPLPASVATRKLKPGWEAPAATAILVPSNGHTIRCRAPAATLGGCRSTLSTDYDHLNLARLVEVISLWQ